MSKMMWGPYSAGHLLPRFSARPTALMSGCLSALACGLAAPSELLQRHDGGHALLQGSMAASSSALLPPGNRPPSILKASQQVLDSLHPPVQGHLQVSPRAPAATSPAASPLPPPPPPLLPPPSPLEWGGLPFVLSASMRELMGGVNKMDMQLGGGDQAGAQAASISGAALPTGTAILSSSFTKSPVWLILSAGMTALFVCLVAFCLGACQSERAMRAREQAEKASSKKAAAAQRHPRGNYSGADYGGEDYGGAAPRYMVSKPEHETLQGVGVPAAIPAVNALDALADSLSSTDGAAPHAAPGSFPTISNEVRESWGQIVADSGDASGRWRNDLDAASSASSNSSHEPCEGTATGDEGAAWTMASAVFGTPAVGKRDGISKSSGASAPECHRQSTAHGTLPTSSSDSLYVCTEAVQL